jgi:hypothetical protein
MTCQYVLMNDAQYILFARGGPLCLVTDRTKDTLHNGSELLGGWNCNSMLQGYSTPKILFPEGLFPGLLFPERFNPMPYVPQKGMLPPSTQRKSQQDHNLDEHGIHHHNKRVT